MIHYDTRYSINHKLNPNKRKNHMSISSLPASFFSHSHRMISIQAKRLTLPDFRRAIFS